MAKEVLILITRDGGTSVTNISQLTGLDTSNVSRRYDAAKQNIEANSKLAYARSLVEKKYDERTAESQA